MKFDLEALNNGRSWPMHNLATMNAQMTIKDDKDQCHTAHVKNLRSEAAL